MTNDPRGSAWRKWDLHLHAPGTKLNDGYGRDANWDRFCQLLEESDVAAYGITDYFSLSSYFECVEEFEKRYPNSQKVFIPNLEMRLNESVNRDGQSVDVHLLLRPDLSREKAERLLEALQTEILEPETSRQLSCAELHEQDQFERATVTRKAIDEAIKKVFGGDRERRDNVLIVVPANNSGIRAVSSERRKANLADAIDAWSDAIFGSDANSEHFLRKDRFDDRSESMPKPVYGGCDAHSFDQLTEWLGQRVESQSTYQVPTWIKADVTFEGLQQTLVEPEERVRLQATEPDAKDPYKVISRIVFNGTSDFPSEVVFNQNLVAIIGSRSSGKSALMAYVAHAIDPDHTVAQQMASGQFDAKTNEAGPAAGLSWSDVEDLDYRVEWGDPNVTEGKIIYIPQNSLFSIASRPQDITEKIAPALYRMSDQYRIAHDQVERTVEEANHRIEAAVSEWFRLRFEIDATRARMRDLGDLKAIRATKASLDAQIDERRSSALLAADEVARFEALQTEFKGIGSRVGTIDGELGQLAPYLEETGGWRMTPNVHIDIHMRPSPTELSPGLAEELNGVLKEARDHLLQSVASILLRYRSELASERQGLLERKAKLETENAPLIAQNTASAELSELITKQASQSAAIEAIEAEAAELDRLRNEQGAQIAAIEEAMLERGDATRPLTEAFDREPNSLDGMTFGFEEQIEVELVEVISSRFNKQERSAYINSETRLLDIRKAQREPSTFLDGLASKTQKLVKGAEPLAAAVEALTASPTIRFYARLDDDRVGGFERSSMTPGKQALFALTLTLSESAEAWPLLIDQPEDDLDSRAIYDTLVPYLKQRKRERQILMVTHNANLAVGADSEQIVVTNRHGTDRRNRGGQTFAYLTGSLEHTKSRAASGFVLEECGVKEHACEILDGGEEAFRKRRDKYKVY